MSQTLPTKESKPWKPSRLNKILGALWCGALLRKGPMCCTTNCSCFNDVENPEASRARAEEARWKYRSEKLADRQDSRAQAAERREARRDKRKERKASKAESKRERANLKNSTRSSAKHQNTVASPTSEVPANSQNSKPPVINKEEGHEYPPTLHSERDRPIDTTPAEDTSNYNVQSEKLPVSNLDSRAKEEESYTGELPIDPSPVDETQDQNKPSARVGSKEHKRAKQRQRRSLKKEKRQERKENKRRRAMETRAK